jgi:hypothetical protein
MFQGGDFAALQANQRLCLNQAGDVGAEAGAVHGQGFAGRYAGVVCGQHGQAAQGAQFVFQRAHSAGRVIGAQRIGADQFGQVGVGVGRRKAQGLHFKQGAGHSGTGQGHGAFAAGQPSADDGYGGGIFPGHKVGQAAAQGWG